MEIIRLSMLDGARQATGTTVIIDVFRAFTTAAYLIANGAERIIPVATKEEAFYLRDHDPDLILIGEIHGHHIFGFDYGNSPYEVSRVDFTGKTVIQRTSSGVQGIINANKANEVLLGSFVIAEATVDYIKKTNPKTVSLVAMGWEGEIPTIEDELCAKYIQERLNGRKPNFIEMKQEIMRDPSGAKFFDRTQDNYVEADFYASMDLDKFNFALKVYANDRIYITKI